MASFASAAAAVRCATRIQRELAQYRQDNAAHPIKVRIGAAAGEPVEHRNDLFGSTVQLAARLCSHAEPEQILVSSVIADLCLGKGLLFQDLGKCPSRDSSGRCESTSSIGPAVTSDSDLRGGRSQISKTPTARARLDRHAIRRTSGWSRGERCETP